MFANILSKNWWMLLLRGLVYIGAGIIILTSPGMSLLTFAMVLGIMICFDGLMNFFTAIGGRKENDNWVLLLLAGLAGVLIGGFMIVYPGVTAAALVASIAVWAMIVGVLQIVAAIRLRKEIQGEFWLALAGVASIVLGGLMLAYPAAAALSVLWLVGVFAIVIGVSLTLLSFKVRSAAKKIVAAVGG
jgi:uncharacterized membrane protein HdeD (DUF308 family)